MIRLDDPVATARDTDTRPNTDKGFDYEFTLNRSLSRLRENSLDTTGFSRVVHQLQPNQSQTLFVIPSASAAWSFSLGLFARKTELDAEIETPCG